MSPPRVAILLLLALLAVHGEEKKDEPLVETQLASGDPAQRERAAERLAASGDRKSVQSLLTLLEDRDWGVRLAATRGLASLDSTPAREALIRQLHASEVGVLRLQTAAFLKAADDEMLVHEVGKELDRAKGEARLRLIEALGILGGPVARSALAEEMKSSELEVRMAAARALGRLGERADRLIDGLKDDEDEVRWLCAVGLAGIDSDSGREAVIRWIDRSPPRDPVPGWVLRRVGRLGAKVNAKSLAETINAALPGSKQERALLLVAWHGRLKDCAPAAREHLRAREPSSRALAFRVAGLEPKSLSASDVKSGLNHKQPIVRYAAASAYLTAAEDPETALDQVLRSKHENVVLVGVRFAADHKRSDAVDALLDVARGATAAKRAVYARSAACVAVGRLARDKAFAPLLELSGERDWHIRAAALEGLIYCWDKEAIPVYIRRFHDNHAVARKVARTNLRYMTRKDFAQAADYEKWWEEFGPDYNLVHPEDVKKKIKAERDKYGYAVRPPKYIQELLGGTDILAIRGRWDFVERVLTDLRVEHTAVFAQKVKDLGLTPKQVVLVNCEGTTDSETTDYLRWFVATGGYMATTDWALINALMRTFPHVLGKYARANTGNVVVGVEPGIPDSPLLEGAFPFGVKPKWWLEVQAFPIVIEDPVRANVLVDSFEMLSRYGTSPMLVEFPAGLGRVIHSTSHFFLAKEGFADLSSAEERRRFAVDHLGLPIGEIRQLDKEGFFDQLKETTPISRSYSMFVMLVNYIREKQEIDSSLR